MNGSTVAVPGILDLCRQFAELPLGTVVRFDKDVDFTTAPGTFRNKLHREMRNDGYILQSVVKGDSVFAKIKRHAATDETG